MYFQGDGRVAPTDDWGLPMMVGVAGLRKQKPDKFVWFCAGGGIRTHKPSRANVFETFLYTSSNTPA